MRISEKQNYNFSWPWRTIQTKYPAISTGISQLQRVSRYCATYILFTNKGYPTIANYIQRLHILQTRDFPDCQMHCVKIVYINCQLPNWVFPMKKTSRLGLLARLRLPLFDKNISNCPIGFSMCSKLLEQTVLPIRRYFPDWVKVLVLAIFIENKAMSWLKPWWWLMLMTITSFITT